MRFFRDIRHRWILLLVGVGVAASLLVLVQVFAMRWNVVVGGQLFSKSFRGFVEFPLHWTGREGLIAAAVVLALPLLAIWIVSKIVPLWQSDDIDRVQIDPAVHDHIPSANRTALTDLENRVTPRPQSGQSAV